MTLRQEVPACTVQSCTARVCSRNQVLTSCIRSVLYTLALIVIKPAYVAHGWHKNTVCAVNVCPDRQVPVAKVAPHAYALMCANRFYYLLL